VLGVTDADLLGHSDRHVPPEIAREYEELVTRRASREPFAYVVGEREFYGRRFVVDNRVLVPRPETETLVEVALEAIRETAGPSPLVVDVGTGSGAIACTLALEAPDCLVVGSDVSADALAVAARNRARLGLDGRLGLVRGGLLDWLGEPADLVVANLPYLTTARVPTLMPEVSRWEPRLALDGGADGTDLIRRLLSDTLRVVRPGGSILLELDPEQIEPVRSLLPCASSRVIRDLAGLDRVLRLDVP
jgi:release factor glutamine methyltransferase